MKDEGHTFLIGLFLGIMLILAAIGVYSNHYEETCEEKHNVYDCNWIYVPVKPEEK